MERKASSRVLLPFLDPPIAAGGEGFLQVRLGLRPQAQCLLGHADLGHRARRSLDGGRALELDQRLAIPPLATQLDALGDGGFGVARGLGRADGTLDTTSAIVSERATLQRRKREFDFTRGIYPKGRKRGDRHRPATRGRSVLDDIAAIMRAS